MLKSLFLFIFISGLYFTAFGQTSADVSAVQTSVTSNISNTASNFVQPRFPGCEEREMSVKYKYLCSQKRFVSFLERVIKYPKEAKSKGVQGKVIISFIVEVDGTVSNSKVERSPGADLASICLRAVELINEDEYAWKPAEVDGQTVRSKVEMPITFSVSYKSIKSKKPFGYINIPDIMKSLQVDEDGNPMDMEVAEIDEDKVYEDVERSVQFRGCSESEMSLIDSYKCSRQKYYAYIKEAIQYPEDALADRVQGIAKIECIIEKDGTVSNPKLLRDPGAGLGQEAIRIVTQMKDSIGLWTPGQIGGESVRTKTELPIRFVLETEDVSPLLVILDGSKKVLHDCIRIGDVSILDAIDGATVKEISVNKARSEYGEKGRYGVYQMRLPKGKGKLPASLRKQEEVEAYEMYFKGLQIDTNAEDKKVELYFEQLSDEAQIVVSNINGRTIHESKVTGGEDISHQLDLNESRGRLFLISIVQKDLVHTQIINL